MKKILILFSYVFHPIFIALFATLSFFLFTKGYFLMQEVYLFLIQIVIITILIPISLFYLLVTLGKIDSIMVPELSQRKFPLFIQIFLLGILIQKSITIDRVYELFFFFVGAIISTFLTLLLLFLKKKASLHMLGISSLTTFVIGLSLYNEVDLLYIISFLVLCNGFVASSRLVMRAHTMKEILLGLVCGVAPQLLLFKFWL